MRLAVTWIFLAGGIAAAQSPTTGTVPDSWAAKTERTVGGPEADLLVRTGDINNLGFGWPHGFDPFSGKSTPEHSYPWPVPPGAPAGTDRIMVGSAVTVSDKGTLLCDGYSARTQRSDTMPAAITLTVGTLPAKIDAVLFQMFLDDFQAPVCRSQFRVSLNGTRIPQFEAAVNALNQSGPIGKLVSLNLLPEYWPLLRSGTVKLLIDDPTTHVTDGYAIDFVRILVNPHAFKYVVSVNGVVTDADTHRPIPGAAVTAAGATVTANLIGEFALEGVPAGMVIVAANAEGYDNGVVTVDLEAGRKSRANLELHKHQEKAKDLERAIAKKGSVAIYGIHFDTGKATLRPDSTPALNAVLTLINSKADSRWTIAGHTDNQGAAELNQKLSEARAASVITWLEDHGVTPGRLSPKGFGMTQPVADNSTVSGRALNRRVEISAGLESPRSGGLER